MAKKNTKTILAALKRAGVSIEDQDKVEAMLDDLELSLEESLGQDQILLNQAEYRELKDDLKALRARAKKAEIERDQFKDAIDSGDSVNKTRADRLQVRVEELEPIVKIIGEQWELAAKSIPAALKGRFAFGEENKPLSIQQLMGNVSKLQEYRELGIIDGKPGPDQPEEEPPAPNAPPRIPNKAPAKLTQEQLAAMPASEKIEYAYGKKAQG